MAQLLDTINRLMNNLYLWLNIGTVLFPVLLSFDKKVAFYKNYKYLFPAALITGTFFLIWDQWFTDMNVWGFNSIHLVGYFIGHIPIEEVMFFVTVPYACLFIYECLIAYIGRSEVFEKLYRWFTLLAFGITVSMLYWFNDRLYTGITCLILSFMLGTHLVIIKRRYMSWFFFAFAISIIPMFIVNGILTSKPVVVYNNLETMNIRIGTIPVEDFFYNMTLLLMNIGLYEWFKRLGLRNQLRRQKQSS
jgi:lycopene cyclase domain-containing protein